MTVFELPVNESCSKYLPGKYPLPLCHSDHQALASMTALRLCTKSPSTMSPAYACRFMENTTRRPHTCWSIVEVQNMPEFLKQSPINLP